MRTLIILVLILAAFISLSTWGYYHIDNSAQSLTRQITKAEQAIAGNNWSAAQREVSLIIIRWEKTKKIWTLLIDHHEMDNIDTAVARVKEVLATKELAESRAGLAELKMFLQHIPQKEALTLENIL